MADHPAIRSEAADAERIRDLEGTVEGQDRYIADLKAAMCQVARMIRGDGPISEERADEAYAVLYRALGGTPADLFAASPRLSSPTHGQE